MTDADAEGVAIVRNRLRHAAAWLAVDALAHNRPEWTDLAARLMAEALEATPAELDRIRERMADPVAVAKLALIR